MAWLDVCECQFDKVRLGFGSLVIFRERRRRRSGSIRSTVRRRWMSPSRGRRWSRPRRAGGGSSRSGWKCGNRRRLKDGDIRTAGAACLRTATSGQRGRLARGRRHQDSWAACPRTATSGQRGGMLILRGRRFCQRRRVFWRLAELARSCRCPELRRFTPRDPWRLCG